MWKKFGKYRRSPRKLFAGLTLIVLGSGLTTASCGGPNRAMPAWYSLITEFFEFTEVPTSNSRRQKAFSQLFSDAGYQGLMDAFGGPAAFSQAHAAKKSDTFPWPGHFQTFLFGHAKELAAITYEESRKTATATTMVHRRYKEIDYSFARIYRFKFVKLKGNVWRIDGVEFVRDDPTIANVNSFYIYAVSGFVVLIVLTVVWPRLVLAIYMTAIQLVLRAVGNMPLAFFSFIVCPLVFYAFVYLFAATTPQAYNSHVGYLLLLFVGSFVLGVVILREVGEHYASKAREEALNKIRENPVLYLLGLPVQARFDGQAYRRASMGFVLLLFAVAVLGFWPYRGKFTVGATSEKQLVFVVENLVELDQDSAIYRVPSLRERYVIGQAAAGDTFSVLDKVSAEDGDFYRVAYGRRSVVHLLAAHCREVDQRKKFQLEGDYIKYLSDLGEVLYRPREQGAIAEEAEEAEEADAEARIFAGVYRDKALEALSQGSLQGLTLAVNELNRALTFDLTLGDLYLHRAYALMEIARFLRADSLHNAFGLLGKTAANPEKVHVLLYRALENIRAARQLKADEAGITAVLALVELSRGKTVVARRLLSRMKSDQHSYALQARLEMETDPRKAIGIARELRRREPDNVLLLSRLGLLQLRLDPARARVTFDQVVSRSPDYLDGRLYQAMADLEEDPKKGEALLKGLIKSESNFPNKAKLYLKLLGFYRALTGSLPFLAVVWIVGLVSLRPRRGLVRHSLMGAAFRTVVVALFLVLICWMVLPTTLPSYGTIHEPCPSWGTVLRSGGAAS